MSEYISRLAWFKKVFCSNCTDLELVNLRHETIQFMLALLQEDREEGEKNNLSTTKLNTAFRAAV
jgi:hypothetical protein